jgi:hypothetical protein
MTESRVYYSDYQNYLDFQKQEADRTKSRTKGKRKTYEKAFKQLSRFYPEAKSVLLLGCRDDFEITTFESFGYKEVVGIDLVKGEKIIECDFSKILEHPTLATRKFDLFLSFDSIEHCIDWAGLRSAILKNCTQGVYFSTHSGHKVGRWDCASHYFMEPSTSVFDIEKHFSGFRVENLTYSHPHHEYEAERPQWRYDLFLKRFPGISKNV